MRVGQLDVCVPSVPSLMAIGAVLPVPCTGDTAAPRPGELGPGEAHAHAVACVCCACAAWEC